MNTKSIFRFDKEDFIKQNKCVPKPYGCGGIALVFKDNISAEEYKISGICQECQDKFYDSWIDEPFTEEEMQSIESSLKNVAYDE